MRSFSFCNVKRSCSIFSKVYLLSSSECLRSPAASSASCMPTRSSSQCLISCSTNSNSISKCAMCRLEPAASVCARRRSTKLSSRCRLSSLLWRSKSCRRSSCSSSSRRSPRSFATSRPVSSPVSCRAIASNTEASCPRPLPSFSSAARRAATTEFSDPMAAQGTSSRILRKPRGWEPIACGVRMFRLSPKPSASGSIPSAT
mmetsp:Transcript_53195/g.142272  ORF Transcript_53195/g.142272 Transcript_53195/m.142272 type:complete len:202 (-) Transcript_53195:10-615(-)